MLDPHFLCCHGNKGNLSSNTKIVNVKYRPPQHRQRPPIHRHVLRRREKIEDKEEKRQHPNLQPVQEIIHRIREIQHGQTNQILGRNQP